MFHILVTEVVCVCLLYQRIVLYCFNKKVEINKYLSSIKIQILLTPVLLLGNKFSCPQILLQRKSSLFYKTNNVHFSTGFMKDFLPC